MDKEELAELEEYAEEQAAAKRSWQRQCIKHQAEIDRLRKAIGDALSHMHTITKAYQILERAIEEK